VIRVLKDEHYFYSLEFDDETGEYFLEVVCGTVAIFSIRIKLEDPELEKYKADPESIRALAYDVMDHPFQYVERAIR